MDDPEEDPKIKTKLTSHHRFQLHAFHIFLIILIVLFLILGGISGPSTGYFWVEITYTSKTGGGGIWRIGGLGACEIGTKCATGQGVPLLGGRIEGALKWHFAAALLYLVIAISNLLLIFFPTHQIKGLPWYTLFLPVLAVLLVLITLIVDIAIKQNVSSSGDVEDVKVLPSFWLIVLALITSLLWSGVAEYIRWLGLKAEPVKVVEEPKKEPEGFSLYSLWPWAKR